MKDLLIEIGAEEIPAGYIEPALKSFAAMMEKKLAEVRIGHGAVTTYGTPRRLAWIIRDLIEKQESITTEVIGPPESVGFDKSGKPLTPALKFAEKLGIPSDRIKVTQTEKGRYLSAAVVDVGQETIHLLKTIIPDLIPLIPFPKTMKWGTTHLKFARPIRWIVAMLGQDPVEFELETAKSGNTTFGHRFMKPAPLTISAPDAYVGLLKAAKVIVEPLERKAAIEQKIVQAARDFGGQILPDADLLDTVNNLVEFPAPVVGQFDAAYLELPDEVLITAMREHQKYFAVVDHQGKLMACFIAVNNTQAKDMELVARGHERVIRARLADARFFYQSDVKSSFEAWGEKLKGVLFQASLGSMDEKCQRLMRLAAYLAQAAGHSADLKQQAVRAAELCKADLVSQVVGEFPKLQGVMGRIYASVAGEPEAVATAIEEHYRPTYSGGPLPETMTGAIAAIADKIDSLCGCFSIGLIPTGASDPLALRRQGIGVIRIMMDQGLSFSLKALIAEAVALFEGKRTQPLAETVNRVYEFLKQRMVNLMTEQGVPADIVAAVTDVTIDNIPRARQRIDALEALKPLPEFEPIAIAFKRVVNIIRKADPAGINPAIIDPQLFEHECETVLFQAVIQVEQNIADCLQQGAFNEALREIAELRAPVDAFFDGVMVMADDSRHRINRLSLLKRISALFESFVDFSKLST